MTTLISFAQQQLTPEVQNSSSSIASGLRFSRRVSMESSRRRGSMKHRGSLRRASMKAWNARQTLRKYFRLALLVVRWLKYVYFRAGENVGALLSVAHVEDEIAMGANDNLLFDVRYFRARREIGLSSQAREILSRLPNERSEQDLAYLHVAFRSLHDYNSYPVAVQEAICKHAWFISYGPKRVVVREGHVPVNFYIILNGSLVVTVFDAETQESRTICFLHRGQAFGEIALATQGRRRATVVTKTKVELLVLTGDDFESIFLQERDGIAAFRGVAGGGSIVDFVQHIPCFADWPIERLTSYPTECMFQYYPRGQLLVADSHDSEWVFVVKMGQLLVYQELKETEASGGDDGQRKKSRHTSVAKTLDDFADANFIAFNQPSSDEQIRNKQFAKLARERPVASGQLPSVGGQKQGRVGFDSMSEMLLELERQVPGILTREDRMGLVDYDEIIAYHLPRVKRFGEKRSEAVRPPSDQRNKRESLVKLKGAHFSRQTTKLTEEEEEERMTEGSLPRFESESSVCPPSEQRSKRESLVKLKGAYFSRQNTRMTEEEEGMTEGSLPRLESESLESDESTLGSDEPPPSTFIKIQTLERGQSFGMSYMLFDRASQPSLSLVSNGCECLMITKRLFMRLATDKCLADLRRNETPYPQDKEMRAKFQEHLAWERARRNIMQMTLDKMGEQKKKRILMSHLRSKW